MRFARSCGVLLHPTSLPGPYGIGTLGTEAIEWLDFLASAGQKIWQVLPLGPTGYADSPYQCFSAFAGNPLLVDLEELAETGLLERADLERAPKFPRNRVDYGAVIAWKLPLLAKAAGAFRGSADFDEFRLRHAGWLGDFALFMALKKAHDQVAWTHWERPLALREPKALEAATAGLAREIFAHEFTQYLFFRQWARLRAAAVERGIRILGDMPIYVAHDSADVWADPDLFQLQPDGNPAVVAGVPPDYFSATGQLWGNPIYRWDVLARRGYDFWIHRFQATLGLVDMIRLDHFRGFQAYWEVPAGERTAQNGRWVEGPGADFFEVVEGALGKLPLVAENLGVITEQVEGIRNRFGYPGMSILQFAFGTDPQGPDFRPHNYPRERVAYTGTHDNDTTVGWWTSTGEGDSTRSADDIRREREFTTKYLGLQPDDAINWVFIRTVLASVADVALYPLQDVLGLGSEARMNLPGRPGGNWDWRLQRGMLTREHAERLKELARIYDR